MITTDRWLTVRYIAACLKLSYGITHHVITNALGYNKVCARWVPRILMPEKKQVRLATSHDDLSLYNADPAKFLRRYVTMDETWAHHFEPETKQQSKQWKHVTSPTPVKFRKIASAGKIRASVFWMRVYWWLTTWREERLLLVFTTLNWSRNFGRLARRNNAERWVTVYCFIKTMHLPTPLPCQWLHFENAASNCSVNRRIHQTWPVWLPRVPIFERFASWTELWLWWRGYPHDKWLVRTARQTVLRGCKLASTSMGNVHCAWRGLYWKTVKWIWP